MAYICLQTPVVVSDKSWCQVDSEVHFTQILKIYLCTGNVILFRVQILVPLLCSVFTIEEIKESYQSLLFLLIDENLQL